MQGIGGLTSLFTLHYEYAEVIAPSLTSNNDLRNARYILACAN